MFLKLFLIFAVIPVLELYFLIKIGGEIGALSTILIILATATLGAYLTKSQGFKVFANIRSAINERRIPANELLQGLFVLAGGLTLLTPGFITDILGITMLIPATRALYIKYAVKIISNKIKTGKWQIKSY